MSPRYPAAQLARPLLAVLFVAFGILLVRADPAQACSCVAGMSPAQYLANADVVFEGTTTNIESPSELSRKYTFNVARTLKGSPSNPEFVTSPRDSATCGFGFEVGTAYRVYAQRDEDQSLSTGLCSGTAKITDLPPDPTTTTTGPRPTTTVSPSTTGPPLSTTTTTVGLDVVVATTTTHDTIKLAVSPKDDDSSLLVPGLVAAAGVAAATGVGVVYARRRRQLGS